MRLFSNIKEAHAALCVDTGFDPFAIPERRRVSKKALREMGYEVNPGEISRLEKEHRCVVCGEKIGREFDGLKYYYPERCYRHRRWQFQCENGHRWTATDNEDRANGHCCPICGEPWV